MLLPYKLNEYRIGVVGHLASGKTVFLTSLIDHIKSHDPDTFRVGANGQEVTHFDALSPDRGWNEFNYDHYRSGLNDGEWPEKGTDRLQFVCRYRVDACWSKRIRLKFYDVPGERMADAAMLLGDFAAWSDQMIRRFNAQTIYRQCVGLFLQACHSDQSSEGDLVREYKRALANLIVRYKQYISPSTFLLDINGGQATLSDDGLEAMADRRFSGLAGAEFCPLPRQVRETRPDIAARFAAHYSQYRRQVVAPIMKTLVKCNRLIVLVDILGVLAGGDGMYADNQLMAEQLFRALRLGKKWRSMLGLLPGVKPGGVSKLACVAPMVDRVAGVQNVNNMSKLLKSMLRTPLKHFKKLEKKYFVCSAVNSTLAVPGSTSLRAILRPGGDFEQYTPSDVPAGWPDEWQPGDYSFPEPYPQVPARMGATPKHIDLDEVFRFLTL